MGKHIKVIAVGGGKKAGQTGCGECPTSCQSACKTSCTVGNQSCVRDGK
ncbi:MAG: six-cysteine ranthipeptide SCIFF [Bacillota bacterium]